MTVVIAGRPNAGKSSLLNRLAGYDAAIVTAIPGTPRDVVRERIHLDGMPLHVLDTAGLRQPGDAGAISTRRRLVEALGRAREHTEAAARQLTDHRAGEVVAEELRAAQHALSEITGEFTSDDLLGRIFAGFCIGK